MVVIIGIILFILGVVGGVVLMCLVQANRVNELNFTIRYLNKLSKTNKKGKTEYDKGYAEGLEYAYEMIKEELQWVKKE